MPATLQEIHAKRERIGQISDRLGAILNNADGTPRQYTADEAVEFDKLTAEGTSLKAEVQTWNVHATRQQLADDTKAAAQACSDGVDKLATQSSATRTAIIAAVQGEGARIKGLQHDALDAIKARPDNPADLCGSIERYLKAQIAKERGVK